jgi:hypothetical protein
MTISSAPRAAISEPNRLYQPNSRSITWYGCQALPSGDPRGADDEIVADKNELPAKPGLLDGEVTVDLPGESPPKLAS